MRVWFDSACLEVGSVSPCGERHHHQQRSLPCVSLVSILGKEQTSSLGNYISQASPSGTRNIVVLIADNLLHATTTIQ